MVILCCVQVIGIKFFLWYLLYHSAEQEAIELGATGLDTNFVFNLRVI